MGDPIFALVPLGASVRRLKADGSLDKYPTRILELSELTRDRKSTRLNSSHSQISYAVFCLKKKNSDIQAVGVTTMMHPRLPRTLSATQPRPSCEIAA